MELPEQTNLVKKKDTKRKRGYLGSTELNMNAWNVKKLYMEDQMITDT